MTTDNNKNYKKAIDSVITQWFGNHFTAFESDGSLLINENQLEELEQMLGDIFIEVKFNDGLINILE